MTLPMTSRPVRSACFVPAAVALLLYLGCNSRPKEDAVETVPSPAGSAPAEKNGASATFVGLEDDWGPNGKPLGVLAITGQQNGYLEPCGCTEGQLGGLARRDALLRAVAEDAPVVAVDLGSLIEDPAKSRGGPDQTLIKLGLALKALAQLKYQAIALSPDDLRVGLAEFFGQYLNTADAPPLVAANVKPTDGLETALKPWVVVEAGSRKIGITAVVDPEALEKVAGEGSDAFFQSVASPSESLGPVLQELEGSSDLQVLLVQGPESMARELSSTFPGFDAVVATSTYVDPPVKHEELNDGKTMLIQVGQKGQNVGLVGLFDDGGKATRYRRGRLDAALQGTEEMASLVGKEYTDTLGQFDVLGKFARFPHPSGSRFVGAETCKSCHPRTFEFWSTTRHAHAYEGLLHGPRGDRQADAECVSCHTTGFGYESGFVNVAQTPYLKAQQCENCHGPGSAHVSDPENAEYRKQVAITADFADRSGVCIRCHDADNDPHYDFKLRWAAIAHKGLDTYASPRVRKGLDVDAILRERAAGKTE